MKEKYLTKLDNEFMRQYDHARLVDQEPLTSDLLSAAVNRGRKYQAIAINLAVREFVHLLYKLFDRID